VDKDGNRETIGQFPFVNDLVVDKENGAVYIVTNSIIPAAAGGGSVVRLTKPDVPVPDENLSLVVLFLLVHSPCRRMYCIS
jgi:hypothetical protein